MSIRRRIARNALWTGAGMASGVVTGFITVPFLVHRLGATTYGLWILIASLTSYFNLADLGLRASITRHVAFFRARGDQQSVNAILSSAQVVLIGAAAVAVIATLCLAVLFPRFGSVPAEQLRQARIAVLLAGFTVAVNLAMSIFDATLWAYERFDILNEIDVVNDVVQTAVLLYLIWVGGSLISIGVVVLAGAICSEIAKGIACFAMESRLRIVSSNIGRGAMRQLFGFGLWRFLWSVGTRATNQGGALIIWARLGVAIATPYGVASRLVGYAKGVSTTGMGIVTPTATALYAEDQDARQRALFVEGGKYCFALSLFFVAAIILLGKSFISLWIGPALAVFSGAATILALGEALPMSQWVTSSILLGRERHRVLALASFLETAVMIAVGLAVARRMGLAGVCLAIAVPGALCRGVLPIVYGGRVLGVSLWHYVRCAVVPPMLAVALPAVAMAALIHRRQPENWVELFVYGGLFSLGYLIACGMLVVGSEQVRNLLQRLWVPSARIPGESHAVP